MLRSILYKNLSISESKMPFLQKDKYKHLQNRQK